MEEVFPNTADNNSAIHDEPVQEAYKGVSSETPQTIGVGLDCKSHADDKNGNASDAVYKNIANNGDSLQIEECGEKEDPMRDDERVLQAASLNKLSSFLIRSERFEDAVDAATEALRLEPSNWEAFLNRYVMQVILVCTLQHSDLSIGATQIPILNI